MACVPAAATAVPGPAPHLPALPSRVRDVGARVPGLRCEIRAAAIAQTRISVARTCHAPAPLVDTRHRRSRMEECQGFMEGSMTLPLRRARRALLVVALLAVAAPVAAPARAAVPTLDWRACGGGFDCATADLPRDYAHPDRDTV